MRHKNSRILGRYSAVWVGMVRDGVGLKPLWCMKGRYNPPKLVQLFQLFEKHETTKGEIVKDKNTLTCARRIYTYLSYLVRVSYLHHTYPIPTQYLPSLPYF